MTTRSDAKVILLANKSPILAPVFLARTIAPRAFQQVKLEFRPSGRKDDQREDLLVDQVLSQSEQHHHYIAGIADPFRALTEAYIGQERQKPMIVANIIPHQLYYLVSDCKNRPRSVAEVGTVDRIFSQPDFMTSYSLLLKYLTETGNIDEATAKQIIYPGVAGYEYDYYRKFVGASRRDPPHPAAFITNDPTLIYGERRDLPEFATLPQKKNTIMTGMFCSAEKYKANSAAIEEIKDALKKAITLIYDDPVVSAAMLLADKRNGIAIHREYGVDNFLRTIVNFAAGNAFASDLSFSTEQIKQAIDMRPRVQAALQEAKTLERPGVYFQESLKSGDASREEPYHVRFRNGETPEDHPLNLLIEPAFKKTAVSPVDRSLLSGSFSLLWKIIYSAYVFLFAFLWAIHYSRPEDMLRLVGDGLFISSLPVVVVTLLGRTTSSMSVLFNIIVLLGWASPIYYFYFSTSNHDVREVLLAFGVPLALGHVGLIARKSPNLREEWANRSRAMSDYWNDTRLRWEIYFTSIPSRFPGGGSAVRSS